MTAMLRIASATGPRPLNDSPVPGWVGREPEPWLGGQPITMTCRRIERVNAEVKTFVFAPAEPTLLDHDPGQYLVLTAEIGDASVSRCYTISSPSTRPYTVAITVKREPTGVMSSWLHDQLKVGDSVEISGPAGTFSPVAHPAPKYLLLAGGVGITPFMSVLRSVEDLAQDPDLTLVHHVRSADHILFGAEISSWELSGTRRRARIVCDQAPPGSWQGHGGGISKELLFSVTPDLLEREVFICGPAAYLEKAHSELLAAGMSPDQIHEESFVLPVAPEPVEQPSDVTGFTLTLARSGVQVPMEPGESVLKAAIKAGVRMPSSCGAGLCGTCKTTMLSGSVDMKHNGGIRPKEIAAGKFLPCCSIAQEDVVIDA